MVVVYYPLVFFYTVDIWSICGWGLDPGYGTSVTNNVILNYPLVFCYIANWKITILKG